MEYSPSSKKENAKYCAMEIKKISKKTNNYLLLEIVLHTGRKHQIRSVLSYFNRPVIGDKKYGSRIGENNKIYLFAYQIIFDNLPSPLSYLNKQTFQISG